MTDSTQSQVQDPVILRSKLRRPRSPSVQVDRPKLLERLDAALGRQLTIVSAGPGFGKTTLAAQWLEKHPIRASWLALDELDRDAERFSRYLVEVLREAVPGGLRRTGALVNARTPQPWPYFVETLISELNEPAEPTIVVLEDYHEAASEHVDDLMERVVEALPETLHLLVLTRVDPPWPLGRWRARGWVNELRSRDLRFSLQETRTFFDLHDKARFDDETVQVVHRKTEGWIAGLCLAEMSMAASARPIERARELSGSDRNIADFLMEDVLGSQPREVREFMAVAAWFDKFCAPLCDHLLAGSAGSTDSQRILALLESENMFLVSLDEERRWYRFHHLFQEFLVERIDELASPQLRGRLDSRAAEWFTAQGMVKEALRHWIAAGDLDSASALVGEHVDSMVREDLSRQVLSLWLGMFPEGAERSRLPLLIAHGHLALLRWDLPNLASLLAQADALSEDERGPFRASLEALRAFLLYWQGRGEDAMESARMALDGRPRFGGVTRSLATIYMAGALRMVGRKAEGLRFLDRAIAEAARHHQFPAEFILVQGLIELYGLDFDAARKRALQLQAAHERDPVPDYYMGFCYHILGSEAYERNRLQEAEDWFERVMALRYLVSSRLYQDAIIGLALIAHARGDAAAEGHAAEARAWAVEVGDPAAMRVADSLESRLLPPEARSSWLDGNPPPANDHAAFWLEVPSVTWAEKLSTMASTGVRGNALPFIEATLQRMQRHHNERYATILAVLYAVALDSEGRRDEALHSLSATLRAAQPYGLVRTFLDRGGPVKVLLDALSEGDGHDGYREMLRGAFLEEGRSPRKAGDSGKEPWKVLSYREIEVLELLAERLTDKEIAAHLSVTPGAIKKRTRNIYRKLHAGDRREAVALALAKGILSKRP